MKLRGAEILAFALALVSFITGWLFYPYLPEQIASHWNIQGEVDGYASKVWGIFLFPIIILVIVALFVVIPRIDPKKNNIEKFQNYYDRFIILLTLFLVYLYGVTLAFNLGYIFNILSFFPIAFAALFYYLGTLLPHFKSNWTIGFRTPWTLSDPIVWDKTHLLAGKLFKATGLIALLGLVFTNYAFWLLIIPAFVSCIVIVVYSYLQYKKI